MLTEQSIPEAPDPIPDDIWSGTPKVVLDGHRYAIGWQRFPADEGGPAYVTARRSLLGDRRVLDRYPLTADGWARAWSAFAQLSPATAEKTRVALGRFYAARPPAGMLAFVPGIILSAVEPPTDEFAVGQAYDLRFGEQGLRIARSGSSQATAEYRYADVEAVQITGIERVLIASKLQLLTWQVMTPEEAYEYRTHLRVQTSDRTLDYWYVASLGKVYRWLEPVNRAIRAAWFSAGADQAKGQYEWIVSELTRLSERLEHGTLTKSDLELLKARINSG